MLREDALSCALRSGLHMQCDGSEANLCMTHCKMGSLVLLSGTCTCCDGGALGDERHLVFECTLRQTYADLLTDDTGSVRSFFAQQDHMRVFHFTVDCLDFMGK